MKRGRQHVNRSMVRIDLQTQEALTWLRFVLNPETAMPLVKNWAALFSFAEKQSLTGICLPEKCPKNLSKSLLFQWIGIVQQIEVQNRLVNKRVEELFEMLGNEGFSCCLLKGQGNAGLYPFPLKRCSGDIDLWINSDISEVYKYVRKRYPDALETIKHIHFPVFNDVPVDIHITPLKFYSNRYDRRLQAWIEIHREEQFANKRVIDGIGKPICIPTVLFNIVYQLGHMLIHLYDEGVGLRQVVDYFYLLKSSEITMDESKKIVITLNELGMLRFAKAVMWIENVVLGLPIQKCIVKPNVYFGKKLLEDILEGGNFGHYSGRYNNKMGFFQKGIVEAWHNVKMLRLAPRECISRLFFKISTAFCHTFN